MGGSSGNLVDFVSSMGGLGEGYVRLRVAEAERRQAKHDVRCVEDAVIEMLRNSRDAGARHIYVATTRDGARRVTTVLDDGVGIPEDMHERVFEARVTSKLDSVHMDRWGVHGRGMALFSIRENSVSAEVVSSAPGKGSSLRVVTDVESLAERADQSSWPQTEKGEDGIYRCVRGPHNIIRTCCEFALEERSSCDVYLGSPSEIVATARARAARSVDASQLVFLDSLSELPVLERLRVASDASELREQAASLGLEISERTAHRIVSGEIAPLRSVAARLVGSGPSPSAHRDVDLTRDRRGLRLSREDVEELARSMERDFAPIAERYYLTLLSDPKVRVGRGRITVIFDVGETD